MLISPPFQAQGSLRALDNIFLVYCCGTSTAAICLKCLAPQAHGGIVQLPMSEEWAGSSAVLQEATVNLSSSSATYGTLFGPAPERGTGLCHLIFHFDNGWLPMATGQPMRTPLLEGDGGKRRRGWAVRM